MIKKNTLIILSVLSVFQYTTQDWVTISDCPGFRKKNKSLISSYRLEWEEEPPIAGEDNELSYSIIAKKTVYIERLVGEAIYNGITLYETDVSSGLRLEKGKEVTEFQEIDGEYILAGHYKILGTIFDDLGKPLACFVAELQIIN